MPLPPRRKRCSFGGKEGVWWRRKSLDGTRTSTTASDDTTPENQAACPPLNATGVAVVVKESTSSSSELQVEWDDALARPVYRRSGGSEPQQVVSSEDEEGSPSPSSSTPEQEPPHKRTKASFFSKIPQVRRNKSFGGRATRRPLSLLLTEGDDAVKSPPPGLPTTSTADADSRSSDLFLQSVDSSITSEASPVYAASEESSPQAAGPFDFEIHALVASGSKTVKTKAARKLTPQRPTATSSVKDAQEYFAHLDASCQLQLDSSYSSPQRKGSLVRTNRKVPLNSPGFQQEYAKYAKASRELNVSPLPPAEYARSRRDFFRKNELFNGFVDS